MTLSYFTGEQHSKIFEKIVQLAEELCGTEGLVPVLRMARQ